MKENKSVKYHDKIARTYDSDYEEKRWKIAREVEWAKIQKYLPAKGRILDAGGGTGSFSIKFAKLGYDVVLTDLSEGMLKIAEKKVQNEKLDSKITILKQDITKMKDLKSNSFNFVVSLGDPVSYCLQEEKAIKELARVAKKGAYVLITVDSLFRTILGMIKQQDWKGLEKVERTSRSMFAGGSYLQHNFRVGELKKLFIKNGLEIVDVFGMMNFVNKVEGIERILENKNNYHKIQELEQKYASEPSIVGLAGHIGIVGRKII